MRCRLALVAVLLAACASSPGPPTPELQAAIARSERLGAAIYAQDQAAWRATDAVRAAGLAKPPIEGWIVVAAPAGQLVRFVAPCGDAACSLADVDVDAGGATRVRPMHEALAPEQAAMWSARKLALSSGFRACSESYNTVGLASEHGGRPACDVYLLAASADPKVVPLGGHHRITVSPDGARILESKALSLSCVVGERDDAAAALVVTHALDPYPIETHVFTNLNYQIPIYVGTETANFAIEVGKIRVIER